MTKAARRLSPVCALLATIGCATGAAHTTAGREARTSSALYPEELALVRADSEVFAGVVRAQLAATDKEPPFHLESPRFDARPYGNDSAFASYARYFKFDDSTFLRPLRNRVVRRIIANRKSILAQLGVAEGGPRSNPGCPGILVAPLHPGNDSAYREQLAKLRAACPRRSDNYVTVGLPLRGVPAAIASRMKQVQLNPELSSEVWTALVETASAGPGGSMWQMNAWLFQRGQAESKLKLAHIVLFGIAE